MYQSRCPLRCSSSLLRNTRNGATTFGRGRQKTIKKKLKKSESQSSRTRGDIDVEGDAESYNRSKRRAQDSYLSMRAGLQFRNFFEVVTKREAAAVTVAVAEQKALPAPPCDLTKTQQARHHGMTIIFACTRTHKLGIFHMASAG